VFPNEQLGKEASVLEQLQLGTIQIYCENAFFHAAMFSRHQVDIGVVPV